MANIQKNIRYTFKETRKNPEYSESDLIPIIRSCLRRNKSSKIKYLPSNENWLQFCDMYLPEKEDEINQDYHISTKPKWITTLIKEQIDLQSKKVVTREEYQTNDMKSSVNRKVNTVNKFCDYYDPLYRDKKVSLLFHTFTRINYSKKDMATMVECAKRRYKSLKRPIRGFIWVLEVSETNHIHYHFIVAIDRFEVKKIPEELKFQDLWGQRTGVEFIRKSVKSYLTKYLYKSDKKIIGKRSYAISRKLV